MRRRWVRKLQILLWRMLHRWGGGFNKEHYCDPSGRDITDNGNMAMHTHNSSTRGRGRGSKRYMANSKGLVQAVVQQQKGQANTKKASSQKH